MIAWVDVETTGLDERTGELLEVAIVVTDDELNVIRPTSVVINARGARDRADEVVVKMHDDSGLWEDLHELGLSGMLAEDYLIQFVGEVVIDPANTPLAGSSVGFDRRWLREHMPRLESLFSYRSIDVSSISELARRWDSRAYETRPQGEKKHRALPDVRASIAALKHYRACRFIDSSVPRPDHG